MLYQAHAGHCAGAAVKTKCTMIVLKAAPRSGIQNLVLGSTHSKALAHPKLGRTQG
jgi:nucleotide-binding universal stress UspA family protein